MQGTAAHDHRVDKRLSNKLILVYILFKLANNAHIPKLCKFKAAPPVTECPLPVTECDMSSQPMYPLAFREGCHCAGTVRPEVLYKDQCDTLNCGKLLAIHLSNRTVTRVLLKMVAMELQLARYV